LALADRREARLRGKPSRFGALGNWITGRH